MNAELKKFSDDQQEKIEELSSSLGVRDNKIRELQKNIADLQENKKNFVAEIKLRMGEIDSLKSTIKSKDEDIDIQRRQINKLESELKVVAELRGEIDKRDSEISNLKQQNEENESEIVSLQNGLHNLQIVHEESQVKII